MKKKNWEREIGGLPRFKMCLNWLDYSKRHYTESTIFTWTSTMSNISHVSSWISIAWLFFLEKKNYFPKFGLAGYRHNSDIAFPSYDEFSPIYLRFTSKYQRLFNIIVKGVEKGMRERRSQWKTTKWNHFLSSQWFKKWFKNLNN